MDPDDYQQAWQTQSSQTRVTVDADLLLKEVQRNRRDFRALIVRRDVIEVGIALLLLPLWFYLGVRHSLPWTWYLTMPVLFWIAGFMLVYQLCHKQKPTRPDEGLLQCVERSLTEVEDQIWLLRNIFWWYLLPPSISILTFFVHVTWLDAEGWFDALGRADNVVFVLALYYFIYWLNQRAVRLQLEPRRRELLAMLASLGDESTEKRLTINSGAAVEKTGALNRLLIPACLCFVAFKLCVLVAGMSGEHPEGTGYPRVSPFAAVRWQNDQPEIQVGEAWYKLMSLNDLSAAEVVAFSRDTYAHNWQKRFEEDLVELLSRMGHPPGDSVKLVVQSLSSSQTRVLEDVPMTAANRQAIKAAGQARENAEP